MHRSRRAPAVADSQRQCEPKRERAAQRRGLHFCVDCAGNDRRQHIANAVLCEADGAMHGNASRSGLTPFAACGQVVPSASLFVRRPRLCVFGTFEQVVGAHQCFAKGGEFIIQMHRLSRFRLVRRRRQRRRQRSRARVQRHNLRCAL